MCAAPAPPAAPVGLVARIDQSFPAEFGHSLHAFIKRTAILQRTIIVGADQQFDPGRAVGKLLVDVAFPIGNDCYAGRAISSQTCGRSAGVEPTATLFVGKRSGPKTFLAAGTTKKRRVDEPEQTAIIGVHRDHRMQVQTLELAIIP